MGHRVLSRYNNHQRLFLICISFTHHVSKLPKIGSHAYCYYYIQCDLYYNYYYRRVRSYTLIILYVLPILNDQKCQTSRSLGFTFLSSVLVAAFAHYRTYIMYAVAFITLLRVVQLPSGQNNRVSIRFSFSVIILLHTGMSLNY